MKKMNLYVFTIRRGFYTDENVDIDVHQGIPRLRESWIDSRDDVEFLTSNSSLYAQQRLADEGVDHIRFEHLPKMRIAKQGKNVTQMHYARQGIITPEMEYIAIRENLKRGTSKRRNFTATTQRSIVWSEYSRTNYA